jgi:hypothetical protein
MNGGLGRMKNYSTSSNNQLERRHRQDLFSQRRVYNNNNNNNNNNNKIYNTSHYHQSSNTTTTTTSKSTTNTSLEAQSIQKSLLKTQHLLRQELHRISNLTHAIDHDESMLQHTMYQHQSLSTKQAQQALISLQRIQQQEQRVLMVSLLFFTMVVLYIWWCRVWIKLDILSMILNWIV